MHGATVNRPFEMPTSVDGVAQSTSQVTHRTLAFLFAVRSSATARVRAGLSWSFSTRNWSGCPSTPPAALIFLTSSCAAASAGPSKNFIVLLRSIAAPITIGLFELAAALLDVLLVALVALLALPALLVLLLLDPQAATASVASAVTSSVTAKVRTLLMVLLSLSLPSDGCRRLGRSLEMRHD